MPGPATHQPQVASSATSSTLTLQPSQRSWQVMPPQQPTLVLSTGPATAPPLSKSSNWYTAPKASGDPGYVSPLIDLYGFSWSLR